MTMCTPGVIHAFDVSIDLILAWAIGDRRVSIWSMPGSLKSSM
jgi:hypothetical protein